METYLVGGAVRDKLLGIPATERDWVVVGATEQQLIDLGFTQVGKDFPVLLHPETKEEYALARTERKIGKGHTGFVCDANASVTLKEDLYRRDLTINAIAESADGMLIDPYDGKQDIEKRILRQVSPAFEEDPLRILRVARFAARFENFDIHPDTMALMQRMVQRGDLQELAPERIFAEIEKTLNTKSPQIFFNLIAELAGNELLWPEISSDGIATLAQMARITDDRILRFSALLRFCDSSQVSKITARLRLPKYLTELAKFGVEKYVAWHQIEEMDSNDILEFLYDVDAFRRNDRFYRLNKLYEDISSIEDQPGRSDSWLAYFNVADSIKAKDLDQRFTGKEIGTALKDKQREAIALSG